MLLEMNVKLRRGHFNLTTQLSIDDSNVGLFGKSGAGKSTVLARSSVQIYIPYLTKSSTPLFVY